MLIDWKLLKIQTVYKPLHYLRHCKISYNWYTFSQEPEGGQGQHGKRQSLSAPLTQYGNI